MLDDVLLLASLLKLFMYKFSFQGPIEITITENIDVEIIGKKFETTNICGKMVVQFPPEIDRCVHFVV
jgi:hypothetical protein